MSIQSTDSHTGLNNAAKSLSAQNRLKNSLCSERQANFRTRGDSPSAKIVPLWFNTDNTGFAPPKTIFGWRSDWENQRRLSECCHGSATVFSRTSIRDSVSISTLSDCLSNKSGNCRKGCHKTQRVDRASFKTSCPLSDLSTCASIRLMLGVVICE